MNSSKFAITTLVAAAAMLGASGSFAYGTSQDSAARVDAAARSAIALNPNGDDLAQPAFRSLQSRADVSRDAAQTRRALPAVAANPNGPVVVAQPTFEARQSRAEVRRDVAENREVLPAIASNPNGDDVLQQGLRAATRTAGRTVDRDDRS